MTGIELERISIKTPCPKSWDEMQGGARRRFCDVCSLHVHNLSALTRSQGESLLRERAAEGGRLCVTYARRADGTVVTADAPAARPHPELRLRPWALRVAQAAALLLSYFPFLSALAGAAALAGCGPASADPDSTPADPGIPVAPPAPADPALPTITGDVALPEPVLQMGRVALEPTVELGKVAVELGEMEQPPAQRE